MNIHCQCGNYMMLPGRRVTVCSTNGRSAWVWGSVRVLSKSTSLGNIFKLKVRYPKVQWQTLWLFQKLLCCLQSDICMVTTDTHVGGESSRWTTHGETPARRRVTNADESWVRQVTFPPALAQGSTWINHALCRVVAELSVNLVSLSSAVVLYIPHFMCSKSTPCIQC